MTAAGVVESIDALDGRGLWLPSCWLLLTPDQIRLQRFEEPLNRCVVAAVASATDRWSQAAGLQRLLIIIGTVLAAAITIEDANTFSVSTTDNSRRVRVLKSD